MCCIFANKMIALWKQQSQKSHYVSSKRRFSRIVMSETDKINMRNILNEALKESFRKMLDQKKKLGQSIVTVDQNGNPIVLTAEEAERIVIQSGQK